MKSPYLEKLLGSSSSYSILMIANSFLVGFIIYFAIQYLLSNLSSTKIQNPYEFFIRIVIIGILMNNSFFLCEQVIDINNALSSAIRDIGNNFLNTDICFSKLNDILNSIVSLEEENESFFSIDGIIKTVVSIGFVNLIFTYSIRYILIKVFILISPFAILCTSNPSTMNLFKSWLKSFISMLFIEVFASLILIVIFSISYSPTDIVSKLLFVGAVFALMKTNDYVREIIRWY